MFGAPGEFAALLNKQRNEKNRKSSARYELQKKKEELLKDREGNYSELQFPEVSTSQLEMIKKDIRKKAHYESIKNLILTIILVIIVTAVLSYWAESVGSF